MRALTLLWRAAPGLSLLAVGFILAEGALPVLVLIAMGRVTGAIPGAVEHGLSSPAGPRLLGDLAAAGAVYALSLMRGPMEDALTAAATAPGGLTHAAPAGRGGLGSGGDRAP